MLDVVLESHSAYVFRVFRVFPFLKNFWMWKRLDRKLPEAENSNKRVILKQKRKKKVVK